MLALTVALADGSVVSTPLVPRGALGPDLKSFFIGSEGTLGVILDVTLKIFPHPALPAPGYIFLSDAPGRAGRTANDHAIRFAAIPGALV